ncbi:hypothetical protein HQQ82_00755 [Rathayibacter sp. VKM Ac-2856]|uniref:hypothetical protein n=1 Tax=unclassified Rathayibacter TaxID=2609250 RepID=UPI001566282F|nr:MULTISPECIES: hypothetical protein [unclassified Rathayibacter]NQX03326.1 hypothetical protein [Rathayibacter sp. VKM Ac-2858]NQX18494.1 hypothetical protein [Rathayibacter sp. VKM Ac-2856]
MTAMNVARMVAIGEPLEVGTADVPAPGPKEVRVIDLSFLQHRTFALDEVNDALAFVGDRPGGHVTVSVLPNGPLDSIGEDA